MAQIIRGLKMIEQFDPLKGEMFQVLNEKGEVKIEFEPKLREEELKKMYKFMVLAREADLRALKLQRQGRMGTYAPSLGHEACQVGAAFPLEKDDWAFPHFRDLGLYIAVGFPLKKFYLYWMGNEIGMYTPPDLNIFTLAVSVASQIPQAVGAGMAASVRKRKIAVLCSFSDGATSEGDFHEALNFAGVFNTPNVFVCYNNQYAISMPRKSQSASKTLAQKALAYGFRGVLVDGNDVLAMYAASKEALEKARERNGPTLIEAFTYRMGDHTTSDDASRYRTEEEVKDWERKDPIQRFRIYLKNKGFWDESFEKEVQAETVTIVEKAVEEAEKTPLPAIEDLFIHTYKIMPQHLKEQMEELKAFLKEREK
jgi:pyruvate dehydrogenase E1 component alpha subunit